MNSKTTRPKNRKLRNLLAAGMVSLTLFGLGGCATYNHDPHYRHPGPRAGFEYYYYPDHNIYYNIHSHFYYYHHPHHGWRKVKRLPGHIHLGHHRRHHLKFKHDHPWDEHHKHKKHHSYYDSDEDRRRYENRREKNRRDDDQGRGNSRRDRDNRQDDRHKSGSRQDIRPEPIGRTRGKPEEPPARQREGRQPSPDEEDGYIRKRQEYEENNRRFYPQR